MFSSNKNTKPFNIADRLHFQKLRDAPTTGLLLSDVVIARTDGRATAIFGRALHDANGHFLGIVSALLDFEHWQTVFSTLNIGQNGLIALIRSDTHQLILQRPAHPDVFNKPFDSPIGRRIAAGEKVGVAQFISPIDGVMRIQSFHVLKNYPIYVVAAISNDDALSAWRRQGIVAALSVTIILIGCGILLSRLWRAEIRRAISLEELAKSEAKIRELAYYDSLTNLPNRRFLIDQLNLELSHAKRYHRSLAIMFIDLDNFKKINDTLGHDVGDELLKAVAIRLTTCVRTGDIVSRPGGDEFIIVLSEISHPDDAALVADKIIDAINVPVQIADNTLNVSTSIGIAVYPINGSDDSHDLMRKADKAMYAAKAAGRNGYRFFTDGIDHS